MAAQLHSLPTRPNFAASLARVAVAEAGAAALYNSGGDAATKVRSTKLRTGALAVLVVGAVRCGERERARRRGAVPRDAAAEASSAKPSVRCPGQHETH